MTTWVDRINFAGFDLETTSTDPTVARPVMCALIHESPQGWTRPAGLPGLINPGMGIPTETTAIHGVTTSHAEHYGAGLTESLETINASILGACRKGLPIVGANVRYDLTVLDHNSRRNGITPLHDRAHACGVSVHVIDPMVLDRWWDRYRRGPRSLRDLCLHYNIAHTNPHDATADAVASAQLAREILRIAAGVDREPGPLARGQWEHQRWMELRGCRSLAGLHELQQRWHLGVVRDREEYRRRTSPDHVEPRAWPVLEFDVAA